MKFAKINLIDVMSGKKIGQTIALPQPIAMLQALSMEISASMNGRLKYDLEVVSKEEFHPELFIKYMDLKLGKIDSDQYQEAVSAYSHGIKDARDVHKS